jgi:hypothetical protein
MNNDCNPEALESLATGAPTGEPIDRASLEAHVERCDACKQELAWLRTEHALFAKSAEDAPSIAHLWPAIEAKLPPPPVAKSPYRTAAPAPVEKAPVRWRPYAVAAASVAALLVASGLALYPNVNRVEPSQAHRINQAGSGREAIVPTMGPVAIRLETSSADVRIEPGHPQRIRVTSDATDATPTLVRAPDGRHDVLFDGRRLEHGRIEIELPEGSAVEVVTASGDVTIGALAGRIAVQTSSGDVDVRSATNATVTTASGEVTLRSITGTADVRTASGDVRVSHVGAAAAVQLHSTSGSLSWQGRCAQGCQLSGHSVSGDVELAFLGESGATVRYATTSGSLDDRLDSVEVGTSEGLLRRFGSGQGSITIETTSGSLALRRAR